MGLGNGLGVGLIGIIMDSYDIGFNMRFGIVVYGMGLSVSYFNDYGVGFGILLVIGYGMGGVNVLGLNVVLDFRYNFGLNYGGVVISNG